MHHGPMGYGMGPGMMMGYGHTGPIGTLDPDAKYLGSTGPA